MMEEQKFKDQLREGFLELRNHQQNKAAASSSGAGSTGMHRPSSQNNMYGSGGMGPAVCMERHRQVCGLVSRS